MPPRTDPSHRIEVIRLDNGACALLARVAVRPGEVLVPLRIADLLPEPVRHSIQVGVSAHALVEPAAVRFTNHSCDPNVMVDTTALCLRAIRPIEPGAEITYFYPSTEWSMAEPFACRCGAARCLHEIAGAAHIAPEVLAGYELATHIRLLLRDGEDAPPRGPGAAPSPPGPGG